MRTHCVATFLQTRRLRTLCRRGVHRHVLSQRRSEEGPSRDSPKDGAPAERLGRLQRQGVSYTVPQKLAKNKDVSHSALMRLGLSDSQVYNFGMLSA